MESRCAVCINNPLTFTLYVAALLAPSSEVRRWLPRPVVRRDGSPGKRGASQRCGVSVRLPRGPGLRGSGDAGLWHEGNEFVGVSESQAWVQHPLTTTC